MSSEFFHDWSVLYANLDRFANEEEREILKGRMGAMLPQMVNVLETRLQSLVTGASHRAPVAQEPLKDDYSFDEFAELFEKYDRNVSDSLRVWFKDIEGGFDASSPEDRSSIYGKARDYLEHKSKAAPAPRNTQGSNNKPFVKKGGFPKKKVGPCPECDDSRLVMTMYGQRYRCDEHDWWGNA